MLNRLIRRVRRTILPLVDHRIVDGSIIPSPDRRSCGLEFKDDSFYLASAEHEAHRMVEELGVTATRRVLDVGSGQGRLAIGLTRVVGPLPYLGLDVDKSAVEWCRTHITSHHPTYQYRHVESANQRYNKAGKRLDSEFRFDLPDNSYDVIYLYSVFSHMTDNDVRIYLDEFRRILSPEGLVFFTTFVETNVAPWEENPPGYKFETYHGPLHVVRFDKDYLFQMVRDHGFIVKNFEYGKDADGQSSVYLSRA